MATDRSPLYAELQTQLIHRRSELTKRLNAIERDLERIRPADDDDRAVESDNDEVLEGLGEAGQKELEAIEAAFGRLKDGTFGTCVRCSEPISEERLWAIPQTPLCEFCAGALART